MSLDYWKECISISSEECGIILTDAQIECLAEGVQGGFENYSMAHGYDCIRGESDESRELKRLKSEKEKYDNYISLTKPCHFCNDGIAKDSWGRDCTCNNCYGKGRIYP